MNIFNDFFFNPDECRKVEKCPRTYLASQNSHLSKILIAEKVEDFAKNVATDITKIDMNAP